MRNLSGNTSLLSLNTATVREQWTLQQCIEGCARYEIGGIAPWRDKLADCGLDKAARLIRDAGLTVTGLCRAGMFPAGDALARQVILRDNMVAVDQAAALGAQCLVILAGGLPEGSRDLPGAHQQVRDGLAELLDYARSCGVPLAIEPLHPMFAADRACVNTLSHALDLCDELGDGVGVAIDAYHVWWDPDLYRQIARAGPRIMAFHVCDWLVPTRDLLLDRGMMGDGVIDLPAMRAAIEAAGFEGLCEVEIFSAQNWWKRPAEEVLQTCIERHQTVV